MSVRHGSFTVHILNNNIEWSKVVVPNDLAASAVVYDCFKDKECIFAFEEFGQTDDYKPLIVKFAQEGKRYYEISKALDEHADEMWKLEMLGK